MKKYVLLQDETKVIGNVTLFRIFAVRDFTLADGTVVKHGSRGGYVQAEKNLSHEGSCWVADEAIAAGKSVVSGSALIKDQAMVCGRAQASGNAIVSGQSKLSDCAKALNNAVVHNQDLSGIDTMIGMHERQ